MHFLWLLLQVKKYTAALFQDLGWLDKFPETSLNSILYLEVNLHWNWFEFYHYSLSKDLTNIYDGIFLTIDLKDCWLFFLRKASLLVCDRFLNMFINRLKKLQISRCHYWFCYGYQQLIAGYWSIEKVLLWHK